MTPSALAGEGQASAAKEIDAITSPVPIRIVAVLSDFISLLKDLSGSKHAWKLPRLEAPDWPLGYRVAGLEPCLPTRWGRAIRY